MKAAPKTAKPPPKHHAARSAFHSEAWAEFLRPPRFGQVEMKEPYRQSGWFQAILGSIIKNISGVPFKIYKGSDSEPILVEEGEMGSEWVRLMEQPNPQSNGKQFIKLAIVYFLLGGETLIVKDPPDPNRPINPDEVPHELYAFPGEQFVHVTKRVGRSQRERLVGWVHRDGWSGQAVPYDLHEIIHFFEPNPYDRFRGLPRWDAAEMPTQSDWKAQQYQHAFFDNDATPGLVFYSKERIAKEQAEEILTRWRDKHQGRLKRAEPDVLGGGLELKEYGHSMRDMEFEKLRRFSVDELLAMYGVPKTEIALHEYMTYANAQSADHGYWIKTLLPIMEDFTMALWNGLFRKGKGGEYWGAFDVKAIKALEPMLNDRITSAERLRNLGYTQNQVNETLELGMENVEWGDIPLVPAGLIPVEDLTLPPDEEDPFATNPPPGGGTPVGEKPSFLEDDEEEGEDEEAEQEGTTENTARAPGQHDDGELPEPDLSDRDSVRRFLVAWNARRPKERDQQWMRVAKKTMIPWEPRFRRKYRGYLIKLRRYQMQKLFEAFENEEQASAIAQWFSEREIKMLRSETADADLLTRLIRATEEDVLFEEPEWNKRMKTHHNGIYYRISQDAIGQVFEELGGNFAFDLNDPLVVDLVTERSEILVRDNATIRKNLAKQFQEGMLNGESVHEIAARFRETFNGQARRSLTVARTETAGITNSSRFATMDEEGVEKHQWITAKDEAVRISHRKNDGKTVVIGNLFPNGLSFPCQPGAPPGEVINCRCVAVAIV